MDLFADRLGNVTVADGVIRIDFLRLKEVDNENQKAQLEHTFRLVMPIEGMLQTVEALEQVKQGLIEQIEQRSKNVAE